MAPPTAASTPPEAPADEHETTALLAPIDSPDGAFTGTADHPPLPAAMYLVCATAAIGSLLFGYDTGVIAGALLYIEPEFELEDEPFIVGLIVASTLVGAMFGSAATGKLSDKYGRRRVLLIASVWFTVGGIGLWWSPELVTLIVARFVVGVAIGLASTIVPLYISELAPAHIRGKLSCFPQLFVSTGVLLSYTVDFVIAVTAGDDWRLMLGISIVPAIIQFFLISFLPESPRWLMTQGRRDDAIAALRVLRGTDNVGKEITEMEDALEEESRKLAELGKDTNQSLWDLASNSPYVRRALFVGCMLNFLQQMAGVNAVVYYTPAIMAEAGVEDMFEDAFALDEDEASLLATILAYSLKVPTGFVAMYLMDRWGRRQLLLTGVPVMAVALTAMACMFAFAAENAVRGAITVVGVCAYGVFFTLSLGPIPAIFASEIFPSHVRAKGISVCLFVQWTFNILVSETFPAIRKYLGLAVGFTIFASICVFTIIFTYTMVWETKGVNLEDMEESVMRRTKSKGKGVL